MVTIATHILNRGPAPFHRLTPNKRFEPVFSTVIMAVCSPFNRMLLLTDLIPVHLVYCWQTVMIGCNHTSFERTRAVRHIYGIIRHMQSLYKYLPNKTLPTYTFLSCKQTHQTLATTVYKTGHSPLNTTISQHLVKIHLIGEQIQNISDLQSTDIMNANSLLQRLSYPQHF